MVPKHILKYARRDVRSITGSNIRNILLLTEKDAFADITKRDIRELMYKEIANDEFWKIGFIREIIEVKNEQLGLNDFTKEELNDILAYLCTS